MNNLNLSENSNNLNDSSKTQEKLYSNDPSLDDILTYSDDISQNQSYNKSLSKPNISIKEGNQKEVKPQTPIICSFNSEITMSFLNNEDKEKLNNIIKNKEYKYPKSASKPIFCEEELNLNDYKKNLNKSFNDHFKHPNFIGFNDPFEENIVNNLKDVSGFHASISNIFSEFEIKDISISKSNNDIKRNNSEKEQKVNNLEGNNKNQISEEHSNTNSMCNYQNNSNLNDITGNNNKNDKKILNKEKMEKNKNDMISSDEIGEINIKMNISLDNFNKNKNKFSSDKKNFLDEMIDDQEINIKDIFTTSNKKESTSFYAQNMKQAKNSIKYTKAQCVQVLFQNNPSNENKQYILSDAPIKTKDTTSDKKNTKKIISLSPHKLSFEIQKNDSIQISYNKNKNKNNSVNDGLNNNISIINNNSESSISKVEEMNTDKNNNNNNYFYNNNSLKENNTTSFMISSNINIRNKFIHRKISYQKNNNIRSKKIFINNRNINIQKDKSNNFFYNPNHPSASGPIFPNASGNKKIHNELHTPDLNKNKITPMTCVHKGSLIYYNETNNGDGNNTIKYNYSSNISNIVKKNKSGINSNSLEKKPKVNNQKKLVYLKSNANKNNRINNKEKLEFNSKIQQDTIINNKNNSYIKIKNENNNVNKKQGSRKNFKNNGNQIIKRKKISEISNNNNSKINNSFKKNLIIKNNSINNNNNSITSNNTHRIIRGVNKIKIKTKSNSIINKINNEIIKESSLFHILYNMPARNANTTKNNSGMSSKDDKESTIIQKNKSKEKEKEREKENQKKISKKKLIKHKTNNSFSLYNSFFEKMVDDSKKKNTNKILSKDKNKNKNKSVIKKNVINSNGNRTHKKINSEINLDSLTSNFNFNNLNIMKRRKNNKSLYNFGNIFFINQNHIIKDEIEPNNSNVIKYINKNMKIKTKDKTNNNIINKGEKVINKSKNTNKNDNMLIVSTKQNPKIINDFSKYRKKKEIILKDKNGTNNNKIYNKQEYKETQLISEN